MQKKVAVIWNDTQPAPATRTESSERRLLLLLQTETVLLHSISLNTASSGVEKKMQPKENREETGWNGFLAFLFFGKSKLSVGGEKGGWWIWRGRWNGVRWKTRKKLPENKIFFFCRLLQSVYGGVSTDCFYWWALLRWSCFFLCRFLDRFKEVEELSRFQAGGVVFHDDFFSGRFPVLERRCLSVTFFCGLSFEQRKNTLYDVKTLGNKLG